MECRPTRLQGGLIGLGLMALIALMDVAMAVFIRHRSLDLTSFLSGLFVVLSVPLLALLAYWVYGAFNMRYWLDRNGLVIIWAATRQVIPIGRIERMVKGEGLRLRGFRGLAWPGYRVGQGEVEGVGLALFYATRPLRESLVVVTPSLAYVISPPSPEEFVAAWKARLRLGPTEILSQGSRQMRLFTLPLWGDRKVHFLLALGLVINVALFAYLAWRYPSLPELLPLHFDAWGQVDFIARKSRILWLPTVALGILLVNGLLGAILHPKERLGTYILLVGALLVQVLVWGAVLGLV